MKKVCFVLDFENLDDARVVYDSLNPEIKHKIPKTKIKVKFEENVLKINIEANDISSLRAACNSYLRWINTALSVKKTV
jgi:tRNA threonylcarbamoyladenosine modification (KEOPS) complex  Pcc1 subunit